MDNHQNHLVTGPSVCKLNVNFNSGVAATVSLARYEVLNTTCTCLFLNAIFRANKWWWWWWWWHCHISQILCNFILRQVLGLVLGPSQHHCVFVLGEVMYVSQTPFYRPTMAYIRRGVTENAGVENATRSKCHGGKCRSRQAVWKAEPIHWETLKLLPKIVVRLLSK